MKLYAALLRSLGWAVASFVLVGVIVSQPRLVVTPGHGAEDIRPPAPHSPTAVTAQHPVDGKHCWSSGENHPLPGHVIWQHPDGTTVYSKALTGPALDTLFGDGHLAGRPIAFCI